MRRWSLLLASLVLVSTSCGDCNSNAVLVAEQVAALAPVVDTVEVLQDSDGSGDFSQNERVFVVDPRVTVNKVIRIAFLPGQAVPRSVLADPDFLVFTAALTPGLSVSSIYFEDNPTNTDVSGPPALTVTYDITDDLYDPSITITVPILVEVHLEEIASDLSPAKFVFVLASAAPPPVQPPRITSFSPNLPNMIGWSRPISFSDFGPGATLDDVLTLVDQNLLGQALEDRPSPHERFEMTFDHGMTNLLVSVTPSGVLGVDKIGLKFVAPTFGFFTTFDEAKSETSVGLAPDTVYTITALSNWDVIHAPVISGTQDEFGQFLVPNYEESLYESLLAFGYTPDALTGDTTYRVRTGPVRVTVPEHRGDSNLINAPSGVAQVHVQYAEPQDVTPAPALLELTWEYGAVVDTAEIGFSNAIPDGIDQDGFVRAAGVSRQETSVQLPASGFDDLVTLTATLFTALPGHALVGTDTIRFHHDSIVPSIDEGTLTFTDTYPNGQLDELCFSADCDLETVIVSVPGGTPVTLDASDATRGDCIADERTYCFEDVPLGLPPGTTDNEIEVTITAVDDQGNASEPVTFESEPSCAMYDKFVGEDGRRSAIAMRGDTPVVAWTDGQRIRYAEASDTGTWSTSRVDPGLPADTDDSVFRLGLGIDLIVDNDGRPVVCYVEGEFGYDFDTDDFLPGIGTNHGATGVLRVMKRGPSGSWLEIASSTEARPLGCSLTTFRGSLVVGWTAPDPSVPDTLPQGVGRWAFVVSEDLDAFAADIPEPPDNGAPIKHRLEWDLHLAGTSDRLYFTYRTAHPVFTDIKAPGQIVLGYATEFTSHVQHACPRVHTVALMRGGLRSGAGASGDHPAGSGRAG